MPGSLLSPERSALPVPPRSRTSLPPGSVIGHYVVTEVLGEGGYAITYKATAENDEYAIKEYFPSEGLAERDAKGNVKVSNQADQELFEHHLRQFGVEALTLKTLADFNIVRVLGLLRARETEYIVMDFIKGDTLKKHLDNRGTLSQDEIDRFLSGILSGLSAVHEKHLVHSDIKPSNIMVREDNSTPVLIDFGTACRPLTGHNDRLTPIATPGYGAPEQYDPEGEIGPWTDIYALSATLYRIVTGQTPDPADLRLQGPDTLVPAVRKARDCNYRDSFLKAIDHGLVLDHTKRPLNIADWRRELLGSEGEAEPTAIRPLIFRTPRRHRLLLALVLVGLASVAVGTFPIVQRTIQDWGNSSAWNQGARTTAVVQKDPFAPRRADLEAALAGSDDSSFRAALTELQAFAKGGNKDAASLLAALPKQLGSNLDKGSVDVRSLALRKLVALGALGKPVRDQFEANYSKLSKKVRSSQWWKTGNQQPPPEFDAWVSATKILVAVDDRGAQLQWGEAMALGRIKPGDRVDAMRIFLNVADQSFKDDPKGRSKYARTAADLITALLNRIIEEKDRATFQRLREEIERRAEAGNAGWAFYLGYFDRCVAEPTDKNSADAWFKRAAQNPAWKQKATAGIVNKNFCVPVGSGT